MMYGCGDDDDDKDKDKDKDKPGVTTSILGRQYDVELFLPDGVWGFDGVCGLNGRAFARPYHGLNVVYVE